MTIDEEARLTLAAQARDDFHTFVELAFLQAHGFGLQMTFALIALITRVQEMATSDTSRLAIVMPPRCLKSFVTSVCFPAWVLGRAPRTKFTVMSYSQPLADELSFQFDRLIGSEVYRQIFPRAGHDRRTISNYRTRRGGGRRGVSLHAGITGFGCDIMILDDPANARDERSEAARADLEHIFTTVLPSRFDVPANGKQIIVAQRLGPQDLISRIEDEAERWDMLVLPAQAETRMEVRIGAEIWRIEAGDLLFPDRLPLSVLDERREVMGSAVFAAQYQQRPAPPEGLLFNLARFERFEPAADSQAGYDAFIVSVDTALSASPNADYTAIVVLGLRDRAIHLVHAERSRRPYEDQLATVCSLGRRYRARLIVVERTGIGHSIVVQLHRDPSWTVWGAHPRDDKLVRAEVAALPFIEARRLALPTVAPWLREVEDELRAFPRGAYDDYVDALTQALEYLRNPPLGHAFEHLEAYRRGRPNPPRRGRVYVH